MKTNSVYSRAVLRGLTVILLSAVMLTSLFSQHVVIQSNGTFTGSGTYTIKGNITNAGVAAATTIPGTVTMGSTTALQTIGTGGNGAINFATLNINTSFGTKTTTAAVSTAVSTALSVAALSVFDIGATTLTLSGTSTLNGTGSLNVSNASSTVVYNQTGTSQTVLGLAYAGALTLSGSSTKNLSATASVAGAFSHANGALTVDQDLTVSYATPTFATVADVANTKTLTLSGTGAKSITTVTTTTGSGTIANTGASGLLTIGTLTDNNGSLTGGAGGLTFTNAATNHGTITGGSGAVTFSNTLAMSGGTLTAGAGTAVFNGTVTQTAGSMASAALANLLKFSGNYSNAGGGTLDLTSTGAAEFDGTVTAGTFNLAGGSTVTYGGAAQAIADRDYAGNMIFTGGTKTWTLGAARTIGGNLTLNGSSATTVSGAFALNVSGNVALSSNLTVANAVIFANTTSAVSGTNEIVGTVTRTHSLGAAAYTFNNASTTVQATATPANLTSFSLTSNPSVNPTGYLAGHTVNRKITESYVNTGAFTVDVKLAYLGGEVGGATEARLRDFSAPPIKTSLLSGTYTRVAAGGGFGTIDLPGILSTALASGSELAMDDRFYQFNSIAATAWGIGSTWDQGGLIPTAFDDVVITTGFGVSIPAATAAVANSVQIDAGASGGLTLAASGTATLAVGAGGILNNNTNTGLTLGAGSAVTVTGGNLVNNGAISNAGSITVQ
jgi:fibronectin-binding autotransporter adhesin